MPHTTCHSISFESIHVNEFQAPRLLLTCPLEASHPRSTSARVVDVTQRCHSFTSGGSRLRVYAKVRVGYVEIKQDMTHV